jgi:predicted alternative tryptophan synthase beta-subunit
LADHPDSPGNLGLAISEAAEDTANNGKTSPGKCIIGCRFKTLRQIFVVFFCLKYVSQK